MPGMVIGYGPFDEYVRTIKETQAKIFQLVLTMV
jgi:hypothetical protein